MESRMLNAVAARSAPTSAHFIGGKRNRTFAGGFQQFSSEKTIRSLQYTIPAVGNHYGNAFAPDDGDEEDDDGSGLGPIALCTYSQPININSTTDGECYDEDDEDVDEDVQMSPAIEVISIDPNCDYDTDEEEEEEEPETGVVIKSHPPVAYQEVISNEIPIEEPVPSSKEQIVEYPIIVQEAVVLENVRAQVEVEGELIQGLESDDIEPELENIHRDSDEDCSDNDSSSDSNSSSSNSSSDSDSSKNSHSSSRSRSRSKSSSSSSASSSRSTSTASSHPSDFVQGSDQDDEAMQRDNLAKVIERRKLMAIERRKRTASLNRKSFSLPHSPVGGANGGVLHDMTSLSFEDLDVSAIVNELSPLKIPIRASESDDKLVQELAENNFDLAAYITEDDFVTTDSEKRGSQNEKPKVSPVKKAPKSRGKQLKMLRELMISPKSDSHESGFSKRACTNKSQQMIEDSDSDSEDSESESDTRTCVKIFGIEKMIGKPKRKDDDIKADPTWNPNGTVTAKQTQRVAQGQKTATPPRAIPSQPTTKREAEPETKSRSVPVKTSESAKSVNNTNNKNKMLSAGSQLARNKMLSLMAKNKHQLQATKQQTKSNGSSTNSNNSSSSSNQSKSLEPPKKKPPIVNNNVKLDHDYCSPKKGSSQNQLAPAPQRKAIEIPFLLPTIDQLRRKKKLSKTKQRHENVNKNVKTGVHCDKKKITEPGKVNSEHQVSNETKNIVSPPVVKQEITIKEESKERIEPKTTRLIPQPVVQTQPKQVSLLKINQNKPNGVQTGFVVAECNVKVEPSDENSKAELINATSSSSNESIVKVKKKLNLQEYKKRREHPTDDVGRVNMDIEASGQSNGVTNTSTVSEAIVKEDPENMSNKTDTIQQEPKKQTECKTPLDPISAAKLKALRMQQLKKEAAIKSTEAKIIPKTVPQIVPLVEITSIKFDEHGNPMPYDKNAEKDASELKLHQDYEEIIIVSIGCNTEITVNPCEPNKEIVKTENQDKDIPKNKLLSNINDTIKRCQSSTSAIISSSSLISSIHDVVIRKKSCNKTEVNEVATATSTEKRTIGGGQANQQGSPNVGVSPPNAFSPGKPEKAGGTYDQSPSFDYDEGQLQQTTVNDKPSEHGEDKIIMHLRKDRQRLKGVSIAVQTMPVDCFPELKRLSPVKKERSTSRSSCRSAQRSQSRQSTSRSRDRLRRQYRRRRSRSSSSEPETRNRSSNSTQNNLQRSSSRRSRSRCSSSKRRSRSRSRTRSRSYRRRSRSNSRRRRSSVSSERRRYYERDYSRRGRSSRRRRSRSTSSHYSSSSGYSFRSRSRSASCCSRSRSRSSSRTSSRIRNPPHNDYRRPAQSPERKIVYVGRLEPALKREDLKRKFIQYGRIKQVTLHYKESGAKYGFVTFEKPQDAYKAIDSSSKDPALSEYDVSFGGRRAFCRTEYADLDGDLSQDHEAIVPFIAPDGSLVLAPKPMPALPRKDDGDSFEELLKKLKKEISAKKPRNS